MAEESSTDQMFLTINIPTPEMPITSMFQLSRNPPSPSASNAAPDPHSTPDPNSTTQPNSTSEPNSTEPDGSSCVVENSEFKCKIRITKTEVMELHRDTKTGNIKCPICPSHTTNNAEQLTRHIRRLRGLNPYICFVCDYSTYNSILFKEHVNIHNGHKPYKCTICNYRSASKRNTLKHQKVHRKDNPFRCDKCEATFRRQGSLDKHKTLMHTKHVCDQCKFVAENAEALHEHLEASHDSKYRCDLCKSNFVDKVAFANHKRSQFVCSRCDLSYCSRFLLKEHMMDEHGEVFDIARSLSKDILFNCKHCKWSSDNRSKILLHLIHHPRQPVDDSIDLSILRKYGIM